MKRFIALLLVCGFLTGIAHAGPEVRVKGLFKDRALLEINGQSKLLKAGQMGPHGVKLLSSNSKQAVVEVAGKRHVLQLSQEIASQFSEPEFKEVRIPSGVHDHYYVSGRINGRSARFLVDTGASTIAMNSHDAKRLGVNFRSGERRQVNTASGVVPAYAVTLNKVSVGGITHHKVAAMVIVGDFPTKILLGNSFLSLVEMREEQGVLVLRSKL